MAQVSLSGLGKSYGASVVLEALDLDIAEGELVVLLGPSGCGKTTTLRLIAGFIVPSTGRILVGGRDVTTVPSHDRNIGVVFQNYALFPHLSVFENVAFGLRRRKLRETVIRERVQVALAMVELDQLAGRMPRELSGGQQQRVAIARATVIAPDILLLDEPLSNLDAKLRAGIRDEIRRLQQRLGITTILVTHDQEEAMSVADRVVVMKGGLVQQIGTPEHVYARPANRFVADFIGGASFIEGEVDGPDTFRTRSGLRLVASELRPECRLVAIRPEAASVSSTGQAGENVFPFQIEAVTYLGPGATLEGSLPSGDRLKIYIGSGGHPDAMRTWRALPEVFVQIPSHAVMAIPDAVLGRPDDAR